jgi:hypothetical protein
MTHTFKIGDLLVWTETAWAKHIDRQNNTVKGFLYLMPPAGFFKIVDIDSEEGLTYYVQSLENPRYEKSLDELNFAKNFQLASEKYQEEAELILDLNDIGLL